MTSVRRGWWILGVMVVILHVAAWVHTERLARQSSGGRADLLLDALVESAEQTLQASHYLEERISASLREIAAQIASQPELRTAVALQELARRHELKVIALYDCHGRLLIANASETLDPQLPVSYGCHDLLTGGKTEHTFGFSAGIFCEADAFGIAMRLPEGGLVRILADVGFVLGFERNVGLPALIDRFRRHPDVQSLDLLNMNGASLLPAVASMASGLEDGREAGFRATSRPLSIHGAPVGRFELVLADQGMQTLRRTTALTISVSALLGVLLLALLARWSARSEEARERHRQLTELERRSEGLARVVAGIAHEIRNPLNTLALGIDSLAGGGGESPSATDARRTERFEMLKRTVREVNGQVQNLLQSTRPVVPQSRGVDLEAWVGDLSLAFATAFPESRFRVEPAMQGTFETDPDLLRRLVWNLLANAAQAGARNIRLEAPSPEGTSHTQVIWRIVDDGPGLPEAVRENLFMPGVTTRVEGSGLGLYNSQRLAISLGGALFLERTDGAGTAFAIKLPMSPPGRP